MVCCTFSLKIIRAIGEKKFLSFLPLKLGTNKNSEIEGGMTYCQREETTRVIITPKICVLAILYHLCFDCYVLVQQTNGPCNFPAEYSYFCCVFNGEINV